MLNSWFEELTTSHMKWEPCYCLAKVEHDLTYDNHQDIHFLVLGPWSNLEAWSTSLSPEGKLLLIPEGPVTVKMISH